MLDYNKTVDNLQTLLTEMKHYADLQKDVVLVGVLSRVEIWSKDRWLENTYDEDEMDEIAEHMAELGFSI